MTLVNKTYSFLMIIISISDSITNETIVLDKQQRAINWMYPSILTMMTEGRSNVKWSFPFESGSRQWLFLFRQSLLSYPAFL